MTSLVDTDRIRAAVSACPGVARVHGRGPNGVSADDLEVEVHVVAVYGVPLPDLGARVDAEIASLLGGRTLNFVVDDVDDGTDTEGDAPVAPAALPAAPEHLAIEPPAPGGAGVLS